MGKLISLVISIIYLVGALCFGGVEAFISMLFFVLATLSCIWYGDEIGSATGYMGGSIRPVVNKKTPGCVVTFMGWILLFLPVIQIIIVLLSTD